MKLKKYHILLSGGIAISAIVPVATVLSCGDETTALATQAEVNAEQERINGLAVNATSSATAVDAVTKAIEITSTNLADVLKHFGLPTGTTLDFEKFSYSYTNTALAAAGDLNFTISVKDKTGTIAATDPVAKERTVTVAIVTLADVNAEQTSVNGLVIKPVVSTETSITATTSDGVEITNNNLVSVLAQFGLPSDTVLNFNKFSYWYVNSGLIADGPLQFKISVKDKSGAIASTNPLALGRSTDVTGITAAAATALVLVNAEQVRINALPEPIGYAITETSIPEAAHAEITAENKVDVLKRFGLLPTTTFDFDKFSYWYGNAALKVDGQLKFGILVADKKTPGIVSENPAKTYSVDITGITAAAADALVVVNAEQDKINKLGDSSTITFNIPIAQVALVSWPTDIANLSATLKAEIEKIYKFDLDKFSYTYTITNIQQANKTFSLVIFVGDKVTPTIVATTNQPIAITIHTNA